MRAAEFVGGPFFYHLLTYASCTLVRKHQRQNWIVHTLPLKEGFFVGIYKKNGLGFLGHNRKNAHGQQHITRAYRPRVFELDDE